MTSAPSVQDMMVAAAGEANGCVVVTGKEWDFAGVEVLNPM